MGQHNSNFELASEARRAAERFDECEIKVIKETFRDLCHVNGGSTRINKETFLQYLPLPGLLGERLFAVFDKKNSGEIDYEEFVCGLAVTCRGSWDEKVEFIFNIYDVHGQGAVNRDELAALLNHVPKSIMRFGRAVSLENAEAAHHHYTRHASAQRRPAAHARHPQPLEPCAAASALPGKGTAGRRLSRRGGCSIGGTLGVERRAGSCRARGRDCTVVVDAEPEVGTTLTSGNLMQLQKLASMGTIGDQSKGSDSLVGSGVQAEGFVPAQDLISMGKQSTRGSGSATGLAPRGLEEKQVEREEEEVTVSTEGGTASPLASTAGHGDPSTSPVSSGVVSRATAVAMPGMTAAVASAAAAGSVGPKEEMPPEYRPVVTAVSEAGAPVTVSSPGGARVVVSLADEPENASSGDTIRAAAVGAMVEPGEVEMESRPASGTGVADGVEHVVSGLRCHDAPLEASTDDGTMGTVQEHSHHPHWEEFTNNDIVDQAFEDCDLNHNGKLSFNEFRLWVERNPIVTQFLQSVFPYDEHREWGDDRKHLPFIHNREITGSPLMSESGYGTAEAESPDDEARQLLVRARNVARDAALRDAIDRLIEQASAGFGDPAVASNGVPVPMVSIDAVPHGDGYGPHGQGAQGGQARLGMNNVVGLSLMNELSPRSARILRHQTVAKEGFLWKQGFRFKNWKQRWYVLVGNCIYYYQKKDDVYPCRVIFLLGSFVEPLQDGSTERKGFWGIEISRHNENHRRKLYTRSKTEQMKWIKELRKASGVVPIEDDFEIGEELGQGRFSRVCMCVNKHTLERKAVKIITKKDMRDEEKDMLSAEIAIMKLVNHPNIIRMESVYESKKDIYIVMELHSGGELFDRIVGRPRFTEDEAFTVIHPLVEAVAYLHEMGIVHRDIKPENILCGGRIGDIKIADFGLSKMVMPDEIMKMPCGTLMYVAPEVLTLNGYGKEADIWSVGTIMYLLLRGRLPFDGDTREEIIENTIHAQIAWENDHVWANFSDEAKDIVLGMLNKDASRRYRAKDVLRHPWITQRVQRQEEHPEQFEF